MKNKNEFEFKYVAPTATERKEIESIRNSYSAKAPASSTKLERLRKLDSIVKNVPVAFSLATGVFGLLLFGLGLAMVLEWNLLAWGIVVACIGCVPMFLAYPIHIKIFKSLKEKHSEEILKLSNELLGEENGK